MKQFLVSAFAVAMLFTTRGEAAPSRATAPAKRPNILFLFADDWAWPHASCLGTPGIQTPTFDRLAREGVLFRNVHVAAPSCSPSRAAILTGQWHWRLEQGANLHGFIPVKFPVYPDLLEKAGYFVGLTGKGYGPGSDAGRPHNAAGQKFKGFDAFLAARPKDQPFCYWYGSGRPHRGYKRDSGVDAGLDPRKVQVPPYLPDNDIIRRDICDYFLAAQKFDQEAGAIVAALEKTGELDDTLIVISGDNGWPFPRSKATCYDTGTHQPLAVRWGSRVKAGRVVDDFVGLADLAPTFLEAAGVAPPQSMTARSFLDVLVSEKSGQIDPSRDHVLTGMERHVRTGRTDGDRRGVGYPIRTIITKQYHYIRNFQSNRWPAGDPAAGPAPDFEALAKSTSAAFSDCDAGPSKAWIVAHADDPQVRPYFDRAFGKRPAQELYDLRNDPHELKNVAEDPAYADAVRELDGRLMAELKATADPRVVGGDEVLEHPTETKPAARPSAGGDSPGRPHAPK